MSYKGYMGYMDETERGRLAFHPYRTTPHAFTLIELILVMAILTFAVSVTAPTLSHFFRGRALDSEARRLLALTRSGQSRAVAEGIPMDLWVDEKQGRFGLQMEPSFDKNDVKAVDFDLDSGLQIQVMNAAPAANSSTANRNRPESIASVPRVVLVQAGLPTIRFLPDGSVGDSSPLKLCLVDRDGNSIWLAQNRERTSYEIRSTEN